MARPAMIHPAKHQPPLPVERLIVSPDEVSEERIDVDVLFVGGGPAGLAGAIRLAQLVEADESLGELEIAVLEKAERPGDHCLSGAVVNPAALRELMPEVSEDDLPLRGLVEDEKFYFLGRQRAMRLPVPPTMHNKGCYVASICEIVRWLADRAEEKGVHVLGGYPADSLLMEEGIVKGVRTAPAGLARDGSPGDAFHPPTEVRARVTILAEGARGPLTQAYLAREAIQSDNPQTFALGVKELWRVKSPLKSVIHTMGRPLPSGVFGGSWLYPMSDDVVSLGLVVGLDSEWSDIDSHALLQQLKMHPLVHDLLEGGELLEWGAKVIPEGGYHSIPNRLGGDGVLIAGDAAGLVNVASLKGIHYAMHSGMEAARAAHAGLVADDTTWSELKSYDQAIRESAIARDLRRTRNMRLAFQHGLIAGAIISGLAWLTRGCFPLSAIRGAADADVSRRPRNSSGDDPEQNGSLTISKLDANFKSGNLTRDDIPLHVIPSKDIPPEVGKMYERLCPAGVYEWRDDELIVNAPNCIDCRATDVIGPRWTVREGGSGPRYQQM